MVWLRWAFGGVGIVGLMVAASVCADPDGWERSLRWAAAREQRWLAAGRECPVLFGEVVPGASYEGYLAAATRAGSCRGIDERRLRELVSSLDPAVRPSPVDREMLLALAPAVALLHAAAHRSGGAGSWPQPSVTPGPGGSIVELPLVIDALRLEARDRLQAGDASGAIEVLLDGFAAGADLCHSLLMVDQMLGGIVFDRVLAGFDGAWWAEVQPEVLSRLGAALATVESVLPCESRGVGDGCATMVLALARWEQWSAFDLGLPSVLPAWQQGFSVRRFGMVNASRMTAVAMQFESDEPAGGEPWAAREARLQRASAQVRAACPDLPSGSFDHVLAAEEQRREVVTRLRLLRLAVARQLGDTSLRLADPFGGGPLDEVPTEAGLLLRSQRPGLQRTVFADH